MATEITFEAYDEENNPLPGQVFEFAFYGEFDPVTGVGTPRAEPAITNVGAGGGYKFQPTDADEIAKCVWVITPPAGVLLSKEGGAIFVAGSPFIAAVFRNELGEYVTDATLPTFDEFLDLATGTPETEPDVLGVDIGGGVTPIFAALPTGLDVSEGRKYLLKAPPGFYPSHYGGDLQETPASGVDATEPGISNVTPPEGSALDADTEWGFDVTDPFGNLVRDTVLVFYPEIRKFEVVYFGIAFDEFAGGFAPDYTGTRTVIVNGFRFANVMRRGGWPSRPTFVVDPFDSAGNVSS